MFSMWKDRSELRYQASSAYSFGYYGVSCPLRRELPPSAARVICPLHMPFQAILNQEHIMAKILICYYSRTQHTQRMAEAVAEGAAQIGNTDVETKSVDEIQPNDLQSYDAIIMGSYAF